VGFICSCVSEGGWRADESLENGLSSIKSPAIYGGVYTCCAHQRAEIWQFPSRCVRKNKVIGGYGLNASRAELITTREIAKRDVVVVFVLQDSNAVDVRGGA